MTELPLGRCAAATLLALILTGAALPGEEALKPKDTSPMALPRARDGNIAIQQELDAARKAATLEAYDLFIARHPQHPLAEIARRERAELAARPNH